MIINIFNQIKDGQLSLIKGCVCEQGDLTLHDATFYKI